MPPSAQRKGAHTQKHHPTHTAPSVLPSRLGSIQTSLSFYPSLVPLPRLSLFQFFSVMLQFWQTSHKTLEAMFLCMHMFVFMNIFVALYGLLLCANFGRLCLCTLLYIFFCRAFTCVCMSVCVGVCVCILETLAPCICCSWQSFQESRVLVSNNGGLFADPNTELIHTLTHS